MTDWRILLENGQGNLIRLTLPCLIGRSPKADLHLADPTISNLHSRLAIEAENCVIHDLGSTNGTWINQKRIEKAQLRPGDRISLGQYDLLVKQIEPGVQLQFCWLSGLPTGGERSENSGLIWPEARTSLICETDDLDEGESLDYYLERQKHCLEQLARNILMEETTPPTWPGLYETRSVQWRYQLADGSEVTQIQHYGRQENRIYIVTLTFLPQTPPSLRKQFIELVIEPEPGSPLIPGTGPHKIEPTGQSAGEGEQ